MTAVAERAAWVDARLPGRRTGPVVLHRERRWGRVWRVPTAGGPLWLKEPSAATAFEVALYPVLVDVVPHHVLTPLAVDVDAGLLLLPDGGPDLRERLDGADLAAAAVPVLAAYGRLQRALTPHVDGLLAAGVVDMRPAVLPERFAEVLEVVEPTLPHADAEDRERLAHLRTRGTEIAEKARELAAAPGGASLDHNDLHLANVLGTPTAPHFLDWGDAVVAHPFASMLVALQVLRADADETSVRRARDAYLDAFTDLASHAELVRTCELARELAVVARALVWHRAVGSDPETAGDFLLAPLLTVTGVLDR